MHMLFIIFFIVWCESIMHVLYSLHTLVASFGVWYFRWKISPNGWWQNLNVAAHHIMCTYNICVLCMCVLCMLYINLCIYLHRKRSKDKGNNCVNKWIANKFSKFVRQLTLYLIVFVFVWYTKSVSDGVYCDKMFFLLHAWDFYVFTFVLSTFIQTIHMMG